MHRYANANTCMHMNMYMHIHMNVYNNVFTCKRAHNRRMTFVYKNGFTCTFT